MTQLSSPSPNSLLSSDEAEQILKPYLARLAKCVEHGWAAWTKDYADKHRILGARTRANIVFDEIVACAETQFMGEAGVKFCRKMTSFWLFIGENVIMRFKKFSRHGLTSNIQTRQQTLFSAQRVLPTMEPGTLLNVGYMLDDLQREIVEKKITCQYKDEIVWELALGAAGEDTLEVMPPISATPTPQGPRFVPKKVASATKSKSAKAGEGK